MVSLDDTQPRPPVDFVNPAAPPPRSGPGCLVWFMVGLMTLGISGLIIMLSAVAGLSAGQRTAQVNATASQSSVINDQLNRFATDVADNNPFFLQKRIEFFATLGIPGPPGIEQTATALFVNNLPTATPPPTATLEATVQTVVEATLTPLVTVSNGSGFDLAALFQDAQTAAGVADWDRAITTLDAIMGLDPTFRPDEVKALLIDSMSKKALQLFRAGDIGDLAEANRLYDRLVQFGANVDELTFESYIAGLYLDAVNASGINFSVATQRLAEVYRQNPNYRDVRSRLINEYILYGDALLTTQPCQAVGQYQTALTYNPNDAVASGKAAAAQNSCFLAASQTAAPLLGTPPPGGIAPVGATGS